MDCSRRVLFVFDFDDTCVDGWSDSWILQIAPNLNLEEKIPMLFEQYGSSWCDMMDHIMRLIYENGCGKHEIIACLKKLKIKEGLDRFLKEIKDHPNVDAIILSDGNTQFIAAALEAAGCSDAIMKIYANPATFDERGRLRIKRYHDSYACLRCKECFANTCKGTVLSSILSSSHDDYDKVIYVGDGKNDVCPCVNELTARDCVVAREGHPLAAVLSKLSPTALKPQLQIVDFDAPDEIHSFLIEHVNMKTTPLTT